MAKGFDIYVSGHPKVFDLCVNDQPRVFDIRLNKRLTECDILVYSIPFRDGLVATSRMIFDTYLERLAFQQYGAAVDAFVPTVRIDEVRKTCAEHLGMVTDLAVSLEMQTHYSLPALQAAVEIASADGLEATETVSTGASNYMQLAIAVVDAMVSKQFGYGSSVFEIRTDVKSTIKRSNLSPNPGVPIGSSIQDVFTQYHLVARFSIAPDASLTNLCYRVYTSGSTSVQTLAAVRGTEIHLPLGRGQSGVEIATSAVGSATKIEAGQSAVAFSAHVTGGVVHLIAPESESGSLVLAAAVMPTLKRHRLLNEMDTDTLQSFDNMALDDIDYVIL